MVVSCQGVFLAEIVYNFTYKNNRILFGCFWWCRQFAVGRAPSFNLHAYKTKEACGQCNLELARCMGGKDWCLGGAWGAPSGLRRQTEKQNKCGR